MVKSKSKTIIKKAIGIILMLIASIVVASVSMQVFNPTTNSGIAVVDGIYTMVNMFLIVPVIAGLLSPKSVTAFDDAEGRNLMIVGAIVTAIALIVT